MTEDNFLHVRLTKDQRGVTKECLLRGGGSPNISFARQCSSSMKLTETSPILGLAKEAARVSAEEYKGKQRTSQ